MRIPRKLTVDVPALILVATGVLAGVAWVSYNFGGVIMRNRVYISLRAPELPAIEKRFGAARNSQHGEELIIRDFFGDKRGGAFVDVGANDYKRWSNTYYLETALGWSGVAIDPQAKFAANYAAHRPRTTFVPLFVSDTSNGRAVLYVPKNDMLASVDRASALDEGGEVQMLESNTTTLDDILERTHISTIDFLNIDVELAEPAVLAGFTIDKYRPRLVAIEAHPPVRQTILEYFAKHGYVLVGKYWQADPQNFWFQPLSGAVVASR